MLKEVRLKDWICVGNKVKLNYDDNTSILIQKTDFDRAFGNIVSIPKETLTKEYMHINC